MNKTIVITGANGFIGRYLTEYLSQKNYTIIALIHTTYKAAVKGVDYRQFDLESFSSDIIPQDAAAIIHCAYIPEKGENLSREKNRKATKRLLEISRRKNVGKFVFLSSFSALPDATSEYGKSKYESEKYFDLNRDLVIRPALVKGNGGLYKNIKNMVQRNSVIPVIDGGNQRVQLIEIIILGEIIFSGISKDISGFYNIAQGESISMIELYKQFAKEKNKKTYFIPISYLLAEIGLKILGTFIKELPVNKENLLGLKNMKERQSADIMTIFGVDPTKSQF